MNRKPLRLEIVIESEIEGCNKAEVRSLEVDGDVSLDIIFDHMFCQTDLEEFRIKTITFKKWEF